jgi:hypothetical protein
MIFILRVCMNIDRSLLTTELPVETTDGLNGQNIQPVNVDVTGDTTSVAKKLETNLFQLVTKNDKVFLPYSVSGVKYI